MVTLMLALVLWPQAQMNVTDTYSAQFPLIRRYLPSLEPLAPVGYYKITKCDVTQPGISKPEPMDVPAVLVTKREYTQHVLVCDKFGGCKPSELKDISEPEMVAKWTCKEKSRILLTAEDGTRHCIKFPKD